MESPDSARTSTPSGRSYLLGWAALLSLTLASFGLDHLRLGAFTLVGTLAIAATKASIVLFVFMHVGRGPLGLRLVALLSVVWVLLICLGVAGDVAFR